MLVESRQILMGLEKLLSDYCWSSIDKFLSRIDKSLKVSVLNVNLLESRCVATIAILLCIDTPACVSAWIKASCVQCIL